MSVPGSMRPPRRHRSVAPDRWIVSYADLATLLLAFFAVMYGVSTVDAGKLAPATSSMRIAFAGHDAPGEPAIVATAAAPRGPVHAASPAAPAQVDKAAIVSVGAVRRRLAIGLSDALASGRIELEEDARGLVVSLPVALTFETGRADVQPDARATLDRLADILRPLPNPIRIEGHTDDVPIRGGRYASNWELSTARANAVVAFLIDSGGIEPRRLAAAGYGEYRPRVPNDTPWNRARNRRVDLVVLDAAALDREPITGTLR